MFTLTNTRMILGALVALVAILLMAWLVSLGLFVLAQDRKAQLDAQISIVIGLDRKGDALGVLAREHADWSDAYEAFQAGDRAWLNENWFTAIARGTFDLMAVIHGDGRIQTRVAGAPFIDTRANIPFNLASQVVRLHRTRDAAPTASYIRRGEAVWLLTSHRIRPHTRPLTPEARADAPIAIFGQRLRVEAIAELSSVLALKNPRVVTDLRSVDPRASHVIYNKADRAIAAIEWEPPRPATDLLKRWGAPGLATVVIAILIATFVARKVVRTARWLDQARIEAQAADHAKSVLMANVSHELRTPMNGILGAAQLFETSRMSPEEAELVDIILDSGTAQMTLIEDLLDVARIDAGQRPAELEAVDPAAVIGQVGASLDVMAAAKGVALVLDVDPGLPPLVETDQSMLRQIVTNVAGNAVKFTEQGSVTIGLTHEHTTKARGRLILSVADTGPGIPPDHIDTIFDRFSQVNEVKTAAHTGTGLGLAITKALVDALEGRIEVSSVQGEGSVFTIFLPVALPLRRSDRQAA